MVHRPDLEHIIERQISVWDTRARLQPEAEQPQLLRPRRVGGPWVTISTELGSSGVELAEAVGTRLGWQVFNKQILEAIAEKMNARELILSRLDEHAIGRLQDYFAQLLVFDDPGQPAYLLEMMRVLWAIARKGQAVIVGRGANWLLEAEGGLRVRVIAPFEKRVKWMMGKETLSIADAERRLHESDVDRAAFIRQVFRQSIDEPLGYDLIVNMGTLDVPAAAETVVAALSQKVGQTPVAR
jgi:cytidylate kinase